MVKFSLGQIVATPTSLEILGESGVRELLDRHSQGDWGEVEKDSREMNDAAVKAQNGDLLSIYTVNGQRVWVHTYIGYSTTILLPEEW